MRSPFLWVKFAPARNLPKEKHGKNVGVKSCSEKWRPPKNLNSLLCIDPVLYIVTLCIAEHLIVVNEKFGWMS